MEEGEYLYLIKFMKESREKLYFWPKDDDYSWEPKDSILKTLFEPVLIKEKSTKNKKMFKFEI